MRRKCNVKEAPQHHPPPPPKKINKDMKNRISHGYPDRLSFSLSTWFKILGTKIDNIFIITQPIHSQRPIQQSSFPEDQLFQIPQHAPRTSQEQLHCPTSLIQSPQECPIHRKDRMTSYSTGTQQQ